MIDTIFYFCPTEEQYQAERAAGEISNKTIVFVEESREIYLNGRGYGKTSTAGLTTEDEFDTWKQAILDRFGNILDLIEDTEGLIDEQTEAFHDFIERLNDKIDDEVKAQLDTADSYLNEALNGKMNQAIGEGLEAYQGFVTTDDVTWADLVFRYDSIKSAVNKVNYALDSDGNLRYTATMQSAMNRYIQNNTAFNEMYTRYSWLGDNQNVIEWMISGFRSQTGEAENFAEMFAAARTEGGAGGSVDSEALASLKTEVLRDVNDAYVAKANLGTAITDAINTEAGTQIVTSLTDLAMKSDVNGATTSLITSYNLDDVKTSWTNIKSTANESWARIDAITSRDSNNAVVYNASFLDSAIAGILATSGSASSIQIAGMTTTDLSGVDINSIVDGKMAGYATLTNLTTAKNEIYAYLKDGSGNIINSATIQSNVTNLESKLNAIANWNGWSSGQAVNYTSQWVLQSDLNRAVARLIAGEGYSDTQAAIEAKVSQGVSDITITADNINFNNSTLGGFTISENALTGSDGNNNTVTLSPTDGIIVTSGGTETFCVRLDGSGHIGDNSNYLMNYFLWDTNGYVEICGGSIHNSNKAPITVVTTSGPNYLGLGFTSFETKLYGDGIESMRFKKTGSSNDYILLGGGGTKAITDFVQVINGASFIAIDESYASDYNVSLVILNFIDTLNKENSELPIKGRFSFYDGDTLVGKVYGDSDGLNLSAPSGYLVYLNGEVYMSTNAQVDANLYVSNNAYIGNICRADSFVKKGSSDDYVLLAGGGVKALSEFGSGTNTTTSIDWSNITNKPDLSSYITASYLGDNGYIIQSDLSDYIKSSDISSYLNDYAAWDDMSNYLSNYLSSEGYRKVYVRRDSGHSLLGEAPVGTVYYAKNGTVYAAYNAVIERWDSNELITELNIGDDSVIFVKTKSGSSRNDNIWTEFRGD